MGREIRRVPPNWEHPLTSAADVREHGLPAWRAGEYWPMFDETFDEAADEWEGGLQAWIARVHPDQIKDPDWTKTRRYWESAGGPPDRTYYRPAFIAEPTWYQVYETVSEGTPVSPPFETPEELVDYLAANGDFWAQKRGTPPPSREAAEAFVRDGFGMTGILMPGGKFLDAYDQAALPKTKG